VADFYTMIDGLGGGGLKWLPVDLGDAVATFKQGSVVSVGSVGGLWTVTLSPSGDQPVWLFNFAVPPTPNESIIFFRLADIVPPASNENIQLRWTDGGTTEFSANGGIGVFWRESAPTTAAILSETAGGGDNSADLPKANVTEVRGWNTGILQLNASNDGAFIGSIGGGARLGQVEFSPGDGISYDRLHLQIRYPTPGAADQTLSFRPQYAVLNLDDIS
jgi:hypothetical protein